MQKYTPCTSCRGANHSMHWGTGSRLIVFISAWTLLCYGKSEQTTARSAMSLTYCDIMQLNTMFLSVGCISFSKDYIQTHLLLQWTSSLYTCIRCRTAQQLTSRCLATPTGSSGSEQTHTHTQYMVYTPTYV